MPLLQGSTRREGLRVRVRVRVNRMPLQQQRCVGLCVGQRMCSAWPERVQSVCRACAERVQSVCRACAERVQSVCIHVSSAPAAVRPAREGSGGSVSKARRSGRHLPGRAPG
eukprot:scaffold30515_cov56-Phaeocystis_antarctica.AAC.2